MIQKKTSAVERRSGADRRRKDLPAPSIRDRRRGIEPRKPEVAEIELSDDEWARLQADLGSGGPSS